MKYLFAILSISFLFSCAKKHDYECNVYYMPNAFMPVIVQKHCTEKQLNKWIEDTAIDTDGDTGTIHSFSDVIVECEQK